MSCHVQCRGLLTCQRHISLPAVAPSCSSFYGTLCSADALTHIAPYKGGRWSPFWALLHGEAQGWKRIIAYHIISR